MSVYILITRMDFMFELIWFHQLFQMLCEFSFIKKTKKNQRKKSTQIDAA